MIDLRNHYGFTRLPFGKDLAPGMLHQHAAHGEAAARIGWCIAERALGVITGEVGSGKTVAARAAIAALDQTRHTLIYLANPTTGTRGIHYQIVTALGGRPAHGTAALTAQAAGLLAAEHNERGRVPVLVIDLCRARNYADSGVPVGPGGLSRRASAGGRCRHSYRFSRNARRASGGWYRPVWAVSGVAVVRARSLMVMSAWM
jgi:AAA domain